MTVGTTSLPAAMDGSAYSAALVASGGTAPYTWSLTQGALPSGLALNPSTGVISGTPSASASGVQLTFQVTDSGSPAQTRTQTITFSVHAALKITTTSLPNGVVGTAYSATLVATGGTTPYTWTLSSGVLPAGLTLNASSGVISGTPSAAASGLQLTFQVTDSGSPPRSRTQTLSLSIAAPSGPPPLNITTTTLPNAVVGSAYSATLVATGGTAPYVWTLSSGALPAGLTLNASSGVISGTPTASASGLSLTFKVTDSGSPAQSATQTLSLTVAAALSITTTSLPNGVVGSAYSATLVATGGTTPYTWTLSSGALPAGLTLNASSGVISGTPTASASGLSLTFKVTDSESPAQTRTKTLSLSIAAALSITTTSLPNGVVGSAYSATLVATGGTTPYTWTLSSGALPAGLTLNASSGVISGTPTASASGSSLTFKVTDSGSPAQTRTQTLSLSIAAALSITTTSLPNGVVGSAYSATLVATGGTTPYTWTLSSGALPAGLTLNASSGVISGTPTASASGLSLTFKVTDSGSPAQSATQTLSLTIAAALSITTTSLPNGVVGSAYSATLVATGGTTPYTWTLSSGALPAGLTLNASSGVISGTPSASASGLSLTFKVTDSGSPAQSATQTLSLTVAAALSITTTSLPNGVVGSAYSATLVATGGTTPYTWTLSSGALPAGLTLNASSGVISGTPSASASGLSLTFKVTDSGSPAQSATQTLSLTVAAALSITTTSLPNGVVGSAYSATLVATGGTTPYTWTLSSGALPAGLTLSASSGVISGTPTASASGLSLTFQVTDSESPAQTRTQTLSLTVVAGLAITTTSLPNGEVGQAYTTTLAAAGGTTPYSWTLSSGALPAGLTLNASSGVISGTPSASASGLSLTFQVTDSESPAQSYTQTLSLTVAAALAVTTTTLPNGQVGRAYSAALSATGGIAPLSWSLTSGSLPAGLTLNASSGGISGTPTATAAASPLTFTVTDSSAGPATRSVALTLNVSPATITVTMTPARAGIAVTQTLGLTATTNDYAGVTWSVNPAGGAFSPAASNSGVPVIFTPSATAGVYTLTATSVTDPTKSASIPVGVTDLAGVYTYHNDVSRDGANIAEYALTPANVNTTSFGRLFSCTVDGAVYAQPLWVANLTVGSGQHNVLFVATQHDSLYAFDADLNPCTQLWQVSLIDTSHGANSGETPVPGTLIGSGAGDITPEDGVTGTPVIDPSSGTLYVVSKSVNSSGKIFYQRLHAIDLTTGNEKPGSPVLLAFTYPGTGDGGSTDTFNPQSQNQRAALALVGGTVFIGWSAHEDAGIYYGWIAGYTYSGGKFSSPPAVLNVTPNVTQGGIWMGGGAPAADANGHLYLLTANATFDASSATPPNNDYGDSLLQLSQALKITSWFTPSDQATDATKDADFGAGGAVVLNLSSGPFQHMVIGGGKDGTIYLLNGDSMGGLGDANAWQYFNIGHPIFGTSAFWNNTLYLAPQNGPMFAYAFNAATSKFNTTATSKSATSYGETGSSPSVSASGSTNGIVWGLESTNYCTPNSPGCGPAVLRAYASGNLGTELWNSSMVGGDVAGNAVKFTVPTVANGKVYIGTRGNNIGGADGSTTISGEVEVYGLKPN